MTVLLQQKDEYHFFERQRAWERGRGKEGWREREREREREYLMQALC